MSKYAYMHWSKKNGVSVGRCVNIKNDCNTILDKVCQDGNDKNQMNQKMI